MGETQTFWQYWKTIAAEARKEASQILGIWGQLLSVVVGTAATAILSWLLASDIMTTVKVSLITVALWLSIWLIVFIVKAVQQPVIAHNKQQKHLSEFEEGKRAKLRIVCGRGDEFQYGDSLARIKVENVSEVTISNVKVRLMRGDANDLTGKVPLCLHKMHDNPLDPNQSYVYQKVFTFTGKQFEYFDIAESVLLSQENRALKITHAESLGDVMIPGKRTNLTVSVLSDTSSIEQNLILDFDEKGRPYIDCLDEQGEVRER